MTDIYDPRPPWRQQFDAARDPYAARNTLGITSTGGGGAPTNAEYITSTADATLTNERVLTNTASITWDFSTPGQAKATSTGGGNVSNSGTPTAGQYGKWVTATTIQGVAPATVLSDIGAQPAGSYQPLDADLTSLAAASATNAIYYRSVANTWATVTIGANLTFSGGTLAASADAPVGAEYITSTADATLTAERVLTDTATVTWDRTTAGQIKANATGGGTATPVPPQGRLTLQTVTPVMTTTQAAKTTIYYTPYQGNQVVLYNGTSMVPTTFTELSALTTDTTKSPAAIGASKVNDWYVWSDAGTLRLGHGPDWTSDTVRSAGTALVMVNGILLNAVALTNGAPIQRGTYVGTTRSNASSQLDWIIGGTAVGGVQAFLNVWNCYNRVLAVGKSQDSRSIWTYNATAWRYLDASILNSVSLVTGLAEDAILATVQECASGGAAGDYVLGILLDGGAVLAANYSSTGATTLGFSASYQGPSFLGYHNIAAAERQVTLGSAASAFGTVSSDQVEAFAVTARM